MKPEAQAWLKIALEDMAAADLLLQSGIHRMVCLHSVDLLSLLNAQGLAVDVNHEEAGFLNAVYRSRYPAETGLLPRGEPTADDARKALALAQKVLTQGKRLLQQRGSRT